MLEFQVKYITLHAISQNLTYMRIHYLSSPQLTNKY